MNSDVLLLSIVVVAEMVEIVVEMVVEMVVVIVIITRQL